MKRPCSVDDCQKPAGVPGSARGYCNMHYRRWWVHGSPHIVLKTVYRPQPVPVESRFHKKYRVNEATGCWDWIASTGGGGYGKITVNARSASANRVSWVIYKGPIPKGMLVCHKCDNRGCVNPEHLFLGTGTDNAIDAAKKNRKRKKLTAERVKIIRLSEEPHAVLARRFGVSAVSIAHVRRGLTWSHVS